MNKRLKKKMRKRYIELFSNKLEFKSEKERKKWVSYMTNA